MANFTTGQWTIGHAGFVRSPCVIAQRAGRPVTIATIESGAREEDEANASLIATAPELLAAVEEVLSWTLDDGDLILGSRAAREDWQTVLASRATMLRKLISKATSA